MVFRTKLTFMELRLAHKFLAESKDDLIKFQLIDGKQEDLTDMTKCLSSEKLVCFILIF